MNPQRLKSTKNITVLPLLVLQKNVASCTSGVDEKEDQ